MNSLVDDYLKLLKEYLSGSLSSGKFQSIYLEKFKNEHRSMDEQVFEMLDGLFADVDAFCSDPVLLTELKKNRQDAWYLDENMLRKSVEKVVKRLESI